MTANGTGPAPSIYTSAGQAHLRGAGARAREECERLVRTFVDRANQGGCGLSFSVDGELPGGRISFWLASDPRTRVVGDVNGGIVVLFGQDWATRHDMNGLVRNVVRELILARENPHYTGPAVTRGTALAVPAAPPVQRRPAAGGFVRDIDLGR